MYRNGIKRLLAVILSLCGMIVLSPLLLILCLAIKIDSPGPIFFRQKRVGIHKQHFNILKFRTMRIDTPHDMPTHMLKDPDQYITRVGHFLRKTSLDELPQLWNIFVGDMAVIGPRPALWNQYDLLAERDKYGANDVRPGLTGWAQIHGRDELEIVDKARLDGYYVEHLSFGMDVKCFFGTIRAVLDHAGVVEGGTGNISVPQAADADAADTARPTASHSPAASRDLGTAVSNTANAVGTFIAQGASAMREMNAAKKALADARAHLAELEQRIADQAEELETRQDIAGRYDQIVADQRQAIATAQKTAEAAELGRDAHAAKATELKGQFEQMKTEDDATELRLKAALDAVEAREASSRETGNRLVRRLEDSKRIRDKVKAERDAGIAAAQQTVDATRAQLETLRHEYAELQRNPSANPANYTVRTSELSMQISDTADALRKAEEDVPNITADLEHSLAAAEHAVEQAQAPIADAKRAHQAVTAEADAARDELQTAKTAATTRQRELREKIAAEDKARRDQEQSIANAQADAAHAQSIIEQATEVHDHPEITESLAGS